MISLPETTRTLMKNKETNILTGKLYGSITITGSYAAKDQYEWQSRRQGEEKQE